MATTDIHILWQDPIPFDRRKELKGDADFGIYQLCGDHPIYGQRMLLYIGIAQIADFRTRLQGHKKRLVNQLGSSAAGQVYVGRLAGKRNLDDDRWVERIQIAERWLIYSHQPSWNSKGLKKPSEDDKVHVFNWGNRGMLLPEVSSKRWFGDPSSFKPFEWV